MCLLTKQETLEIAQEDIMCLKAVEIVEGKDENTVNITPYVFTFLPDEVLNGERPFKAERTNFSSRFWKSEHGKVSDGFIHTYDMPKTVEDVCNVAHDIGFMTSLIGTLEGISKPKVEAAGCKDEPHILGITLWKCVIPKGTSYAKGIVDTIAFDVRAYASECIVFKEKIAEFRSKIDSRAEVEKALLEFTGIGNQPEEEKPEEKRRGFFTRLKEMIRK